MSELNTEQQLRIDLHKSQLARQLIERGMLPSTADRTVDALRYELLQTGELKVEHGAAVYATSDLAAVNQLASALHVVANPAPMSAEAAVAHINAQNAGRPNPLLMRK